MVGSFSASFILLEKIRRSSSMSVNPAGGALRLEAWRIAGIWGFFYENFLQPFVITEQDLALWVVEG